VIGILVDREGASLHPFWDTVGMTTFPCPRSGLAQIGVPSKAGSAAERRAIFRIGEIITLKNIAKILTEIQNRVSF
jgi:hypothetical protein